MSKYYVSMTDEFMSGWGHASGKINKLVLECDSHEEAETVVRNAKDRSEMKDIKISSKKPSYNERQFLVSFHGKPEYKRWFSKDRPFKREKK